MYRQIVNALGGFHYGFANRRVCMHDAAELVCGSFERHSDTGLSEQLGSVRADDMNAENFIVFLLGNDFHKAVGLAEYACFSRGGEGKLPDLYVIACFLSFGFR